MQYNINEDPNEENNIIDDENNKEIKQKLYKFLIENLNDGDEKWVVDKS